MSEHPCPQCGGPSGVEYIELAFDGPDRRFIPGKRYCLNDCSAPPPICARCGKDEQRLDVTAFGEAQRRFAWGCACGAT